jgi:Fe-S oxidoreductase
MEGQMGKDEVVATPPKSNGDTVPYGEFFGNVRITGDLLTADAERPWVRTVPADAPHHRYVIWLGCQMLRTAHIAQALDAIMNHLTVDHVTLGGPSSCCGTIHQRRGDIAVGDAMTRRTVDKFDAFTPEQLLWWCPSCDNHLRIKGEEFETETTKNRKSVVEFLVSTVTPAHFANEVPLRVAVHTHHGFPEQDVDSDGVVRILSMIPKLEIIDMPQWSIVGRHCSDTTLRNFGKEKYLAQMVDWIAEARRRGADRVVSIYHSCHRQMVLSQLDAPPESRVEVENYLGLMARGLGLPLHEDKFARFSTLGSVDQIMHELADEIAKSGIDPERARRAIKAHFGARDPSC